MFIVRPHLNHQWHDAVCLFECAEDGIEVYFTIANHEIAELTFVFWRHAIRVFKVDLGNVWLTQFQLSTHVIVPTRDIAHVWISSEIRRIHFAIEHLKLTQ